MHKDERDLLDVLKFELAFLEKGGYGRSPRQPWQPQFIFEDSPTCMNYDSKTNREPCDECVLMQLVPPERRTEKIPCRHVPLNAEGETLDSLYRYADEYETEETYGNWLRATIARIEEERKLPRDKPPAPPSFNNVTQGTPLYHHLHPKCANPACPTAFHWLQGGKFFRFRAEDASASPGDDGKKPATGVHGVKHYWLCEHCSHVFTLVHAEKQGVMLKLRWPELPADEVKAESTAA